MPDFEEYARLQPQLVAPSSANTLQLTGHMVHVSNDTRTAAGAGGDGGGSTRVMSVAADDVKSALQAVESQHVVYIPQLLAVHQSGRVGEFAGSCAPKCDYELMQPGLQAALGRFESVKGCHPFDALLTGEQHAA